MRIDIEAVDTRDTFTIGLGVVVFCIIGLFNNLNIESVFYL
jgi:hypothetical protein